MGYLQARRQIPRDQDAPGTVWPGSSVAYVSTGNRVRGRFSHMLGQYRTARRERVGQYALPSACSVPDTA
eukprot:3462523-Rhodomonas_salina.1